MVVKWSLRQGRPESGGEAAKSWQLAKAAEETWMKVRFLAGWTALGSIAVTVGWRLKKEQQGKDSLSLVRVKFEVPVTLPGGDVSIMLRGGPRLVCDPGRAENEKSQSLK